MAWLASLLSLTLATPPPLICARSGPMGAALGYFESALGLVCPPRKDAGSFLQARMGLAGCTNRLGGLPWAARWDAYSKAGWQLSVLADQTKLPL